MEIQSLEQVKIAAPCPMKWEEMQGDERKRFCQSCELSVYNISDMTKNEAEEFIRGSEGRVCITMFQRADGTILTKNCPVGLKSIRKKYRDALLFLSSIIASILAGFGVHKFFKNNPGILPNSFNTPIKRTPVRLAGEVCIEPPPKLSIPKTSAKSKAPLGATQIEKDFDKKPKDSEEK